MSRSARQSHLMKVLPLLVCVCDAFSDGTVSTRSFAPANRRVSSTLSQRRTVLSGSSFDDIRKGLEESWNEREMGIVPSSPEMAAEVSASSLLEAKRDGHNLFVVDMLIPQYSIAQGEDMYDVVLASDFCMGLAECLESRSVIYVRDQQTLNIVNRVMETRLREQPANEQWEEIEEEIELGGSETGDTSDVDAFRQQLTSSWDLSETEEQTPAEANPPPEAPPTKPKTTKRIVKRRVRKQNRYRVASLFGDEKVSSGPDMAEEVVTAIRKHGKPTDEDDTLILLSAYSPEEAYAVRALTHTFGASKSIVLVNCQIDPLPREWMQGVMAYSLVLLKAQPHSLDPDFESRKKESMDQLPPEPKVCVLRRYPEDWQMYVDAEGDGFKLAGTYDEDMFGIKGPSLDFVGTKLKQYLSDFYWNLP